MLVQKVLKSTNQGSLKCSWTAEIMTSTGMDFKTFCTCTSTSVTHTKPKTGPGDNCKTPQCSHKSQSLPLQSSPYITLILQSPQHPLQQTEVETTCKSKKERRQASQLQRAQQTKACHVAGGHYFLMWQMSPVVQLLQKYITNGCSEEYEALLHIDRD